MRAGADHAVQTVKTIISLTNDYNDCPLNLNLNLNLNFTLKVHCPSEGFLKLSIQKKVGF